MVCLCSLYEKLPTLAGWLPLGHAFVEALKWEQGTRSLHRTVRHQLKTAQTQPNETNSVPTGGSDRGSELSDGRKENTCLWEHPQEGFVCASHGFAPRVSCTTDLNVVNWHGWEDGFLQPGQKSSSVSRRMLQVGKRNIFGKLGTQQSYLRSCPCSSPLLTICTANCTGGYLTTPTWVQEDGLAKEPAMLIVILEAMPNQRDTAVINTEEHIANMLSC